MPSKIVNYTQVPVEQKDLAVIHIERANAEGTLFRAQISYDVLDSEGNRLRTSGFQQDGPGVLAAPAITALLAAINTAEGT